MVILTIDKVKNPRRNLKPEILKPGDKVGIVAPGGLFNSEKFKAGIAYIRSIGLVPVLGENLFKKDFIFAGTVSQRVKSLHKILDRRDLKAVWCVRGGYGCYAVAQELAKLKQPSSPKVLLGMSDVTALHLLVTQEWGWPVLHGPLVDRIGIEASSQKERNCLRDTLLDSSFRFSQKNLKSIAASQTVEAIITGGNLALVSSSLKTSWEIDTRGKILFLEDIGERAYRLDRMFFQLKMSGKLDHVKGVVLGNFTDCREPDGRDLSGVVLKRYFGEARYPVVYGVDSGHDKLRMTIPFGVRGRITGGRGARFEITESCFREK